MKNNTIPVFILKVGKQFLWEYKNTQNNSIIGRPNSKGHTPRTIKGAKNSFNHYAKINNIKKFSFAKHIDGIPTVQTQLL